MDGGSFTNKIVAECCQFSVGRNHKNCPRCSKAGRSGAPQMGEGKAAATPLEAVAFLGFQGSETTDCRSTLLLTVVFCRFVGTTDRSVPKNRNGTGRGPDNIDNSLSWHIKGQCTCNKVNYMYMYDQLMTASRKQKIS